MRGWRGVLAVAALVAGAFPVGAQLVEPPLVVSLEAHEEPIRPLIDQVALEFTVDAGCELMVGVPPGLTVYHEVVDAPVWLSTVFDPMSTTYAPEECQDQRVRGRAILILAASAEAPAYQPATVTVRARVPQQEREDVVAEASQQVRAAWFSLVDARVENASRSVARGSSTSFVITLSNAGNGPARVEVELVETPSSDLRVVMPPPVHVGSRQTGDATTTGSLRIAVDVAADAERGRSHVLLAKWRASYAPDPLLRGDEGMLSMLLGVEAAPRASPSASATATRASPTPTARATDDGAPAAEKETPGAPLALFAVAAGAAALSARRRR